jgi:3-oxoacyl-[acyl-carrier protein] reductase
MDLGIHGRTALVCGAYRGLGRATAEALVAEGVRVMLCARDEDALAAAARALAAAGGSVETVALDISQPGAPAAAVAATTEAFGRVDILVANAGGPPPGRALDVDDDALRAAMEANFLSAVRLVRAAVPSMRVHSWGRICCIASYSVVQPVPMLALSNSARVALWAWAKTAAQDLASESPGVTLNLACPGPHATDRMRELGGADSGAMGDPADFGKVVAFLCSQPAGFVNGTAVVVDGGATLAL